MRRRVDPGEEQAIPDEVAALEPARRVRFDYWLGRGDSPAVALEKARAMPLPRTRHLRAVDA